MCSSVHVPLIDMRCPKCKSDLAPSGAVDFGDQHFTVYQCDACVVPWQVGSQRFDCALTFAVDEGGRLFDPDSFEPLNLN